MNENFHISQKGINTLIKPSEGFRLFTYKDAAGKDSIYYGHLILTGEVFNNTLAEAENILKADLLKAEALVKKQITVSLTQNKFDALVSLAYNVPSAITTGTIDNLINSGATEEEIRKKWLEYIYADGKPLEGLKIRRQKEVDFFLLNPFCQLSQILQEILHKPFSFGLESDSYSLQLSFHLDTLKIEKRNEKVSI